MFWLDIRFHLQINNIFNIAYFYSSFSIKICMQADIGYTCNPLQVLLNRNITKVLKIHCTLNGSVEFKVTGSCRSSVIHLRNWILEYKKCMLKFYTAVTFKVKVSHQGTSLYVSHSLHKILKPFKCKFYFPSPDSCCHVLCISVFHCIFPSAALTDNRLRKEWGLYCNSYSSEWVLNSCTSSYVDFAKAVFLNSSYALKHWVNKQS